MDKTQRGRSTWFSRNIGALDLAYQLQAHDTLSILMDTHVPYPLTCAERYFSR